MGAPFNEMDPCQCFSNGLVVPLPGKR